ncbi:MAG TPA: SIR2 family protein [Acidimicrobiales bacterium]|nr:SIR2 family protein [Acidimicrobiales bacterium]
MAFAQTDDPGRTAVAGELSLHYKMVCRGFKNGNLTPVLGAGASLFGRPPDSDEWHGPPSSSELAVHLAREFDMESSPTNLLEVAQWIATMQGGSSPLYFALHDVFNRELPTTKLHEFLASVPGRLREAGKLRRPPLIVTTNYDDLLEKAFSTQGEPFDLVAYVAEGADKGCFLHQSPDGDLTLIEKPEDYDAVNPDTRTVIVKLHGFVNKSDPDQDSYVITEDHYIEYLGREGRSGRADLRDRLPTDVMVRLNNCHLLFLGYSLHDWNLRAILYELYDSNKGKNSWWSIQRDCSDVERASWRHHGVEMRDTPLEDYLEGLSAAFDTFLAEQAGAA